MLHSRFFTWKPQFGHDNLENHLLIFKIQFWGFIDPFKRPYGYGSIPTNTIFRGMNIHLNLEKSFYTAIGQKLEKLKAQVFHLMICSWECTLRHVKLDNFPFSSMNFPFKFPFRAEMSKPPFDYQMVNPYLMFVP